MTTPSLDLSLIDQAVQILENGGLIAMPTETVYGLAADADNETAVRGTFTAKGRPADHPLIVHLPNADSLRYWAQDIPPEAWLLAKKFWPGPLTMVLKKQDRCGTFVTGGQDTVAIRCPAHPWAQALLQKFSGPTHRGLTAPSCNTFGHISPSCAEHVHQDLGIKPEGKLDMILDGGPCNYGIESTIIDLSQGMPAILRHGSITREQLERVLGFHVPDGGKNSPRVSGRLKSHYAPNTKLRLLDVRTLRQRQQELYANNQKVAIYADTENCITHPSLLVAQLVPPQNAKEYARKLYEVLHRLDAVHADRILIQCPPSQPEWVAILDRLTRAAA